MLIDPFSIYNERFENNVKKQRNSRTISEINITRINVTLVQNYLCEKLLVNPET